VHSLTDIRVRANQPLNNRGLVMWYIATGRTPEDVFFAHGGFFDPDGAYHPCSGDPNCPAMMWTRPGDHFFAHRKKHLFFGALQRRTQSSHPDIAYVRFTYRTHGGEWQPACLVKPGHDSGASIAFSCDWVVPATLRNGRIDISFDVVLADQRVFNAPARLRGGTIRG